MPRKSKNMLSTVIVSTLILGMSFGGAAYGEKGGNGNGNNGNGNGNGGSASNSNSNANQNNSSRQNAPRANTAVSAAVSSMPQRLNAYKSAYVAASTASAEAQKYYGQYQTIAGMTEAEFGSTYPGADYQATLNHLSQQYQTNLALAESAQQDAAALLNRVTADRPLTAQGLAELHQMLGI